MKNQTKFLIYFLISTICSGSLLAQKQIITINKKVNDDKSIDFYYEKNSPGSYSVDLQFSNVQNCDVREHKAVLRSHSGFLMKLRPIDKNKGIGYSYNIYSIMGELNPRIDSLFGYSLPFKNGKKVKIKEAGNAGEKFLGQEKPANWKSFFVISPTPDTICSMRKGIVVRIVNEHENTDSADAIYTSKRNSVTIEHEDGTCATYTGFNQNKIWVKLGESVHPQTEIGVSEMYNGKGYTIHFNVHYLFDKDFKSTSKNLKGYKSKFKNINPIFITQEGDVQIESGKEYTAKVDEMVITKEFSKSEKKKYAKEHLNFK
ncbi:hypothetical protein [Flavobacterium agrisoli]|uniref:Peptidase M23-like protein n=1 Tax=Flavobacterium agrisoli TaxID=2793066 RepID=A0A934UIL8_9FLAO|nr:hypothetical protein [Flavobacterium agrisoli]MBK0368714.1 hypothetical protein [Flavobacterium agrisoli]